MAEQNRRSRGWWVLCLGSLSLGAANLALNPDFVGPAWAQTQSDDSSCFPAEEPIVEQAAQVDSNQPQ